MPALGVLVKAQRAGLLEHFEHFQHQLQRLEVVAVDVMRSVNSEEPDEHVEHSFWVEREVAITLGAQALDQVCHHAIKPLRSQLSNGAPRGFHGAYPWKPCHPLTPLRTK